MFSQEVSKCSVKWLNHTSLIHEESIKEFSDLIPDTEKMRGDGGKKLFSLSHLQILGFTSETKNAYIWVLFFFILRK